MNIDMFDYARNNMRRIGKIEHAFEAWTASESDPIIIDVEQFLLYCKDTNRIHSDCFISGYQGGLVSEPCSEQAWDAGRQEMRDLNCRPLEYTFEEFLDEFSGNGLTEALFQYVQDLKTVSVEA